MRRFDIRGLLTIAFGVAALSACGGASNSNYCAGRNLDNNCSEPALDDAGPDSSGGSSCLTSATCTAAGEMACDTVKGTCGACFGSDDAACTGTMPTCGSDDTCHACKLHSDCASDVCLPTGACGSDGDTAYVADDSHGGSGGGTCTKASPCDQLTTGIAAGKPYVKITGTIDQAVTIDTPTVVTILADAGAKLIHSSNGTILTVQGTSHVTIYDLEISGASGTGVGVSVPIGATPMLNLDRVHILNNAGGGIVAAGGSLTVSQSTISSNPGGGITASGVGTVFKVTNNFIIYNGTSSGGNASQVGGAAVTSNLSGSTFAFNTVAFNGCDGTLYRGGVSCTGTNVTAAGNLVYRNSEGAATTSSTQNNAVGCQYGNTLVVVTDPANLGFKSPITNLDFHLTSTTPATVVDAAGACGAADPIDIDGQVRPQGAGCDFGADELVAP